MSHASTGLSDRDLHRFTTLAMVELVLRPGVLATKRGEEEVCELLTRMHKDLDVPHQENDTQEEGMEETLARLEEHFGIKD